MGRLIAVLALFLCQWRGVGQVRDEQDSVKYVLPPVLVTAAEARARETPATFSNLSGRDITERYSVQDAPALLSELPSTVHYSWNGNDLGYSYLNLRGFEQRRISVMVNGIPQNDPEDHQVYWIDMPDLLGSTQSIQVQRGAGSAFYGPPAIGGSINIVTTPVAPQPHVKVSTGWGFQEFGHEGKTLLNTRKHALSVSSGLINNRYALYGSLSKTSSDGYRRNAWVELYSYFLGAARLDETMTTRIHVYGGPISDGLAYVGIPKYYNNDRNLRRSNYSFWSFDSTGTKVGFSADQKPQHVEGFFQPHYELLHDWKLSSATTLHNTIFYVQGDGFFDYDGDWVPYPDPATGQLTPAILWFRNVVGYDSTLGASTFPSFVLKGFVGNKQWGWLPRIEVDHGQGNLALGGEFRLHRSVHWGKVENASELPPGYDLNFHFYEYNGEKDVLSLYGHELYRLDDETTVMANLQVVYNRFGIKREKFFGRDFDIRYVFVNPRLGINHNIDDKTNAYFALAYTSREPRLRNLYAAEDAWFGAKPEFELDAGGNYDYSRPLAQSEHLLDVELGASHRFDEGTVSANLYWMEFQDELVKSGQVDIFGASILLNAERTRHVGLELEGSCRVFADFVVSGNGTLSTNRIIDHRFFDARDSVTRTLDGNPVAGFPDFLSNIRLRYGPREWSVSLLVKYVGRFFTDNLNNPRNTVDAFTMADLDVLWTLPSIDPTVELQLVGKVRNLLNRLYLAGGEGSTFYPAAERNYFVGLSLSF